MSKENYTIKIISKKEAAEIILRFHYLKDISKGFKSGVNYGLFLSDEVVGVAIFTGFPVPELVKGAFGLDRSDQDGFYELSRLCLRPDVQSSEHNIASWFLSRAIRKLKRSHKVRALLSYADSDFHQGIVYKATNFSYYGLTDKKKDFFIKQSDGSYIKHSRGRTKGVDGEWRDRARKHRFMMIFDKKIKCRWERQPYPI